MLTSVTTGLGCRRLLPYRRISSGVDVAVIVNDGISRLRGSCLSPFLRSPFGLWY
jgi:hypothetical protein